MRRLNINYLLEDGAGAGMSINPVAFLVVQENNVKLMPVDHSSCIDRLIDYVPDLMQKINDMFNKTICQKEEKTKNKKCNENIPKVEKSEQVQGQEKKVQENEKKADEQKNIEIIESDGEVFGEEF